MTDLRARAAQIIASVVRDGLPLTQCLPKAQAELSEQRDIDFLNALCMGAARRYLQLSSSLDRLLHKPFKARDADLQALLVVGLYQLWYMDVPTYAAVSSSVDAAKSMGKTWACGLVNTILRRAWRERELVEGAWLQDEVARYSHPQWLIDELKKAWPDSWESILAANNEQPPLTLRIQTEQITREAYTKKLDAMEVEWYIPERAEQAVCLVESMPVQQLPGYKEGWFYVQDLAGQRVVELLDLAPGLRVLDACAAPGGKTTHMLTQTPDLAALVALDCQPERLTMITENLQRLQLQQAPVKLVLADALRVQQWWDGQQFDRILIDAPCTSTGVIRRHPEIRLRRDASDLETQSVLQQQLISQLWRLLKPGGLLIYTTCSVLPVENDSVVKRLVQTHPDAKLKNFRMPEAIKTSHGRQLLPNAEHDGFYYSRLQKTDV